MKMVIETSQPVARVAKELGVNESTLSNWVSTYRRDHVGEEPPLSVSERVRLHESEREIREPRPACRNRWPRASASTFSALPNAQLVSVALCHDVTFVLSCTPDHLNEIATRTRLRIRSAERSSKGSPVTAVA